MHYPQLQMPMSGRDSLRYRLYGIVMVILGIFNFLLNLYIQQKQKG